MQSISDTRDTTAPGAGRHPRRFSFPKFSKIFKIFQNFPKSCRRRFGKARSRKTATAPKPIAPGKTSYRTPRPSATAAERAALRQLSHDGVWPGAFDGEGEFFDKASALKYEGQFRDGAFHGRGTYYFATGDEWEGEFVAGRMHGHGTFRFLPPGGPVNCEMSKTFRQRLPPVVGSLPRY